MYMTEGHGEKRLRYTRQKRNFITIQSLACFKANVKYINNMEQNYLQSVIPGIFPPTLRSLWSPITPLITENLLADGRPDGNIYY